MKDKVEQIVNEEVRVEKTPTLETPPNTVVANVTGVVDGKMQPLREVRPIDKTPKIVPPELNYQGGATLSLLFKVFEKRKYVKEGLIGDIIYGFDACGIPTEATIQGLDNLNKNGYIRFQAKDNAYVSIYDDRAGSAWVRYQPKLLNMLS